MVALEAGNLNGLVVIIAAIMFGPPALLVIIGFASKRNHPKAAKVLFISATVYLIAGLGICGSLMS
ncbi:MAG TPA: hypothetical protein VFR70_10265 [Flavobacterium sp.]|nr:hypothetical protein [Flavobacterium sp.]